MQSERTSTVHVSTDVTSHWKRVFRATHENKIAACKVISIPRNATVKEINSIGKEIRIHSRLRHHHILSYISAILVGWDDPINTAGYLPFYPAYYLLLELATGGDLFDKIGPWLHCAYGNTSTLINTSTGHWPLRRNRPLLLPPDVVRSGTPQPVVTLPVTPHILQDISTPGGRLSPGS